MQTPLNITEQVPGPPPAGAWQTGRWLVHELASVSSTNWVAASLPSWQAVRADVQTAGRGRFQRSWISNRGGLWLSAVVPIDAGSASAKLLVLGAGLAVCEALQPFGAGELRLRWPNDVLVGERKLAGILIDQFASGRAVVGIGINVANHPAAEDSALLGQAVSLRELVARTPSLKRLTQEILSHLESVWTRLGERPEAVLLDINRLWRLPRPVRLDLDGRSLDGQFDGVDGNGRLRLRLPQQETNIFEPHQVRLLRDLS